MADVRLDRVTPNPAGMRALLRGPGCRAACLEASRGLCSRIAGPVHRASVVPGVNRAHAIAWPSRPKGASRHTGRRGR